MLDREALERLFALERDSGAPLVPKVIALFFKTFPESLFQISSALAQEDGTAIAKQAHSLKSSSGNLGALTLTTLLEQLEMEAKSGEFISAGTTLSQVQTEFALVKTELERLLEPGGNK